MKRTKRKLVIAGATAMVMAGATVALAFITNYSVSGSTVLTGQPQGAGQPPQANVVLSVANPEAFGEVLTAGTVSVQVDAATDISTKIKAADLKFSLMLPVGCKGDGWRIGEPTLTLPDGQVMTGSAQAAGTVQVSFDSNVGVDQTACFESDFTAVFAPGGSYVYSQSAGTFVRVSGMCKVGPSGTTLGAFSADDFVYRVRNEGTTTVETWQLTFSGNPISGASGGSLTPGAVTYVALDTNPAVKVITTPSVNSYTGTAGVDANTICA